MKLSFLGDVFLDRKYTVDLELDMFIFNLEYPLSKRGVPAQGKINLGSNKAFIKGTFNKFPLAVSLANNHIMDYGEESFLDTINYLEENNILYFGAGNKSNNFNNPAIVEFANRKIALLGYSCVTTHAVFGNDINNGSAPIDEERILKDIKKTKEKVDKVIIVLHWGDEFIKYPKPTDVKIAKLIIDAGADMIIGHHAHIVQSFEVYKGKYIFYGLGNCIFPDFKLPSFHNGENFTRTYASKWTEKNNQGLIVDINDTFDISYRTFIFENDRLKLDKFRIPTKIPGSMKEYYFYYKIFKRIGTIKRFINNPKVPTLKQIKIFFNLK